MFDNVSMSVIDNDCISLARLCSLLSIIILLLLLLFSSLFVLMFISRVSWVDGGVAQVDGIVVRTRLSMNITTIPPPDGR